MPSSSTDVPVRSFTSSTNENLRKSILQHGPTRVGTPGAQGVQGGN
jgi:hypothetical protein